MVTIHKAHGLRFVIFVDDHKPAHVHVFGDHKMKVDLVGTVNPALVWAVGTKVDDIRRAMAVVAENRELFLSRWEQSHG